MIVYIQVYCGQCQDLIAEYRNEIVEKYPFWCSTCDDTAQVHTMGKYPFKITTRVGEVI